MNKYHEHDLEEATGEENCKQENAKKYPAIHSLFVNEHPLKVDREETTNTKDNEKDGKQNPEREKIDQLSAEPG